LIRSSSAIRAAICCGVQIRRYPPRPALAIIINDGLAFPISHGHTVAIDDCDVEIKRAFSFKIK
jgi:hypothetical protein